MPTARNLVRSLLALGEEGYSFLVVPGGGPMADLVRQCAAAMVGPDKVFEPEPTMGGEDMSYYLQKAKGCFFFLGVGRPGGAPLHNAQFDFNEDVLLLGVETYCRIAQELLAL